MYSVVQDDCYLESIPPETQYKKAGQNYVDKFIITEI